MVDLGHLAQNAEGLIGESKAQIEKATFRCDCL